MGQIIANVELALSCVDLPGTVISVMVVSWFCLQLWNGKVPICRKCWQQLGIWCISTTQSSHRWREEAAFTHAHTKSIKDCSFIFFNRGEVAGHRRVRHLSDLHECPQCPLPETGRPTCTRQISFKKRPKLRKEFSSLLNKQKYIAARTVICHWHRVGWEGECLESCEYFKRKKCSFNRDDVPSRGNFSVGNSTYL